MLPYYTLNSDQLTDRLRQQVNVATGNLVLESVDMQLPGVAGMDMAVGRYYNSGDSSGDMFGRGWRSSIGRSVTLSVNTGGTSAELTGPSGYRVEFTRTSSSGAWRPPAGLNASLTTSGSWRTVTMLDSGLRYRFSINGTALHEVEDKNGNTITYGYTSGRVTSVTDTRGKQTTLTWGPSGYVEEITDPSGRSTVYGYTGDRLTFSTDPDGNTTAYGYDSAGRLSSVTDPRGKSTGYTYTSTGRLATITWADSTSARPAMTRYTVSGSSGQNVKMTDQRGNVWNYTFDSSGRLESFLSPRSGNPETKAYDVNNSVTDYTTSQGGTGTLSYDGYNVKSISEANGATSTFDYLDADTSNRPSKHTDPRGVSIDYDWNGREQLTKVITASSTTTISYQSATDTCPGVPSSSKDGKGNITTYTYSAACNLAKIDRPAPAGDSTMTYNGDNRLATATDGKGNKQSVSYDKSGRVRTIRWTKPGASTSTSSVAYTYDGNGNRTKRVDVHAGSSKTTTWGLDARNRVTSEALPGVSNSYTYDVAGNMASMTTPAGTTSYTYDIENDPASVTTPTGKKIMMGYGEHVSAWIDFPGGVRDRQDMDSSGRIRRVYQNRENSDNTFTALTDLNYDYTTAAGKKTSSVYGIDDDTFDFHAAYTYDSSGRITKGTTSQDGSARTQDSYGYDANSNITSQSTKWFAPFVDQDLSMSATSTYNAANQMTTVSGGQSMSLTYDTNGAWTGDSQGGAATYDERARASAMTQRGPDAPGSQTMTYDGDSQVERTQAGATTFTNSLLGVTSSTTSGKTTQYILAPDGRVLGQTEHDGSNFYFLRDRLGSTIGVTNDTGQRVNNYWYDPYGGYQGGNEPDPTNGIPNVAWRYTGEWADGYSVAGGTYKIGLRYYDSVTHRWTQTDPIERITNPAQPAESQPYTYVGCNPTNHTDPTGASGGDPSTGEVLWGMGTACLGGAIIGGGVGAAAGAPFMGVGALMGGWGGAVIGCGGNIVVNGATDGWSFSP